MAIQEIWNAKKLYEQEKQASVHLQDFLYTHLVRYDCCYRAHTQIIVVLPCASCAQLSIAQPYMQHSLRVTEPAINMCLVHSCLLAEHCTWHTLGS